MAKQKIAYSKDWHDKGCWAHGKNKYRLEVLPIKDLWASVPIAKVHNGVQFYDKLYKDIEALGYTHIECAMMLGFKHARSHQQVHREKWQGILYV